MCFNLLKRPFIPLKALDFSRFFSHSDKTMPQWKNIFRIVVFSRRKKHAIM